MKALSIGIIFLFLSACGDLAVQKISEETKKLEAAQEKHRHDHSHDHVHDDEHDEHE